LHEEITEVYDIHVRVLEIHKEVLEILSLSSLSSLNKDRIKTT